MTNKTHETNQQHLTELREAAFRFSSKVRGQAGLILDELIDPDGDPISLLADTEGDAGALSLAVPLETITFETWLLGQIGDAEQFDLDIPSHKEIWMNFGAWIGETLRRRHGGHWLVPNEEHANWRLGFSKILLEIAPFRFAEQLLSNGQGAAQNLLSEIERLRENHEEQLERDNGKAVDRFTLNHYIRMHTIPLGQWFVVDFKEMERMWNTAATKDLVKALKKRKSQMPPENGPMIDQVIEGISKAEQSKPLGTQTQDRGLFEAVVQMLAMKRATAPIAMDIMEKFVMPSMYIGIPEKFPPLDEDDIKALHKGIELFELYVDIVPHKYQADDEGFLGCIPEEDLASPFAGQTKLEVGNGDWVIVNPKRFKSMLLEFDSKRLLGRYDEFVKYIANNDKAPNRRDNGRFLTETVGRALADLKACVVAGSKEGHNLLFRMLPPMP